MSESICKNCVRYLYSCPCRPEPGTIVEQCKEYDPHPKEEKSKFMSDEERKEQVGGNHYASHRIQPWDIILDYKLDFWAGNAVKYILREKKDRLEDLKKARHYLDECIRQIEV